MDRATGGHVTDPPYWSSRPESQRGLVWAKDYLWLVDRDGIHAHYPTTTTGSFNRNNGALTMPLVETNDDPRGIVTNTAEDTLWVLDARDRRFYGYPFIPFLPRTENRDVILAADNDQTYALAGADGHLWAFDNADDKGYAYRAAGDATQNATNKNVTLSWRQATDADNRAHYPIRIRRRRAGAANWVAVVPLTMPQFDAATKTWSCQVDADQRNGQGVIQPARWQFEVQMMGYRDTPMLGVPYDVAASARLENTAPAHDPPTFAS